MIVRRRWTKEINKLMMRCFHQSNSTRREYQKRMVGIWREIGTFEIISRVIRTTEWLTEVKLVEKRNKILTPKYGNENYEISDIPVIEE